MSNQYEGYYKRNLVNEKVQELIEISQNPGQMDWESAYWIAKCLQTADTTESTDDLIISMFNKAFNMGLSLSSNKVLFLDAAQILSRLYIRRTDYISAINYLMDLTDFLDEVPDWVNIYYLMAQIMTDNIFRHAEDPYFLFRRLDSISSNSYEQRAKVYQIFLKRLHDIEELGTTRTLNIDRYEELKDKYIGHYLDLEDYEEDIDEEDEALSLQNRIEELETKLLDLQREKDAEVSSLYQKIKEREEALVRIRNGIVEDETAEEADGLVASGKVFLKRNEQILVLGALAVGTKHLIGVAKTFGLTRDNLEFVEDYDKIKHYASRITPGNSRYRAIICGPMPHKVEDSDGYSSLVVKLQTETDIYPYTVKCTVEANGMKITKSSFRNALIDIARALSVLS